MIINCVCAPFIEGLYVPQNLKFLNNDFSSQ